MTPKMKWLVSGLLLLAHALAIAIASPAPPRSAHSSPDLDKGSIARNSLENEYLIQFHDDPDLSHDQFLAHAAGIHAAAQRFSTTVNQYAGVIRHFNIGSGFRALHGHLDPEHVEQLKQLDFVKRIEPNGIVTTQFASIPKPAAPPTANLALHKTKREDTPSQPNNGTLPPRSRNFNFKVHTRPAQNWGQSRLSHLTPNSPPKYRHLSPPLPPTIYLLDTGIRASHTEFLLTSISPNSSTSTSSSSSRSKVRPGPNFTLPPDHPSRHNSSTTDQNGHGTHTAATAAGNTFGIVPPHHPVHLVAVQVFSANGTGTWDGVIEALQWVGNDTLHRKLGSRAVVNLSLGGGRTEVVNDAVTAVVRQANVTVVVAAGNDNNLTEYLSPASCPDAITVAATDRDDARAGFSSYGKEVDLFAPGVGIMSAGFGDDHASVEMSGTSMAAPHVAGLAAYFMMVYGAHTPDEMRQRLMDVAIKGVVKNKGDGSTDALAYNGIEDDGGS
ncbi:peptidase S8/S53 domain-containing protein [Cercophora samala]|uniref:Peptidase S8/S53 domain-containing protein n=1 Tax=Cercophora samala TaxID=330535 RepID=A0AA39ZI48_9PEZI|nr:peptidase S8/S53 domain-containing protein [Cercophora samala]